MQKKSESSRKIQLIPKKIQLIQQNSINAGKFKSDSSSVSIVSAFYPAKSQKNEETFN
jgi:hypothetical protein